MNSRDTNNAKDFPTIMDEIKRSDLSEAEKIAQAFGYITSTIIEHTHHEIELARAMQDQEKVVKQQIKLETLKHARGILQTCYQLMIGKDAWEE
jgi:hypothetical protein